jgi:hypothetical protein
MSWAEKIKYFVVGTLIVFVIWFFAGDGHISINSEHTKIYLLKGGYRSWTIQYSHGHQLQPDGTWKNLWKWPTFHHADIRILYRDGIIRDLQKH